MTKGIVGTPSKSKIAKSKNIGREEGISHDTGLADEQLQNVAGGGGPPTVVDSRPVLPKGKLG
jgi:hypothetical protein